MVHRNQFIIYEAPFLRDDFKTITLDSGLYLSYQTDLQLFDVVNQSSQRIIFIGEAIDTAEENRTIETILRQSSNLDTESLFDLTFSFSGRWVVVFGNVIISDPCALLGLFFSAKKTVVSSSLALISEHTVFNELFDGVSDIEFEKFPDWYPIPLTRLKDIHRKMPHQYLIISQEGCDAVFHDPLQTEKYESLNKQEIIDELLAGFDVFFRNAASQYGKLLLPLTAGCDSRTLYALARHSGVDFTTITFFYNCLKSDIEIPEYISSFYGTPHKLIRPKEFINERASWWDEHTFKSSVSVDRDFFAQGQFDGFPSNSLILRGNVLEIFFHYWDYKYKDASIKDDILESLYQGSPGFLTGDFNIQATNMWVDDILSHPRKVSWKELVLFEQRQSGWLGYIEQGLDLADFKHFPPIDSARFMSMLFALKDEDRTGRAFQKELINQILPELSGLPYNSKTISETARDIFSKIRNLKTFGEITAAIRRRLP